MNILNFLLLNQHHNLFFLFFIDLLPCEMSKFQLLCDRDQKKNHKLMEIKVGIDSQELHIPFFYHCVFTIVIYFQQR